MNARQIGRKAGDDRAGISRPILGSRGQTPPRQRHQLAVGPATFQSRHSIGDVAALGHLGQLGS